MPARWHLTRRDGALWMEGHALPALTERFGSPLHVASAPALRKNAREVHRAFADYPTRAHFSYKTNLVAVVLRVLHEEGIGAEVVDGYELWLAQKLGVRGDDIVFNGPNKSDAELEAAAEADVGLLVLDGLDEIARANAAGDRAGRTLRVGLRLCPDIVPRGMNTSSMTGSRKNQFGIDPAELPEALRRLRASPRLRFRGMHAHIGSGIHDLRSFRRAVNTLLDAQLAAARVGFEPDLLDIGGGLGARHSREFTTFEMLWYLGTGRLPAAPAAAPPDLMRRYATTVIEALDAGVRERGIPRPTLVLEPGRALTSDAQVLLLTVGAVRDRAGIGSFALTDGGAMTVSMMFLSEHHTVMLANRDAPARGVVSVFGRLPSPMDVVYKNLPLPPLRPGDVLAVMDAGAYFTSTATNFGGPRAAVVMVDGEQVTVARRRETWDDLGRIEGLE